MVYLFLVGAAMFDTLATTSNTIAYQSDTGGFVSLIGYIAFAYAYTADELIFHETFNWVEMVAAIIIVLATGVTSVYKIREANLEKERVALEKADDF